jgi:hypothetical protein
MKSINDATEVEKGSGDACADDQSTPWIETVLTTLNQRPEADRQALLNALMHGHETVAGDGAVSGLTSRSTDIRAKPTHRSGPSPRSSAAHPVSAPYLSADMNLAGPKSISGSERAGAKDRRAPVKPV